MKKFISASVLFFILNSVCAQFQENYTQNFFTTLDYYENYYDSLRNAGVTDLNALGYKFFNRWKWTYLPKVSAFQGDWVSYNKSLNEFYSYKDNIFNNTNPNAISFENATWEEMGPNVNRQHKVD